MRSSSCVEDAAVLLEERKGSNCWKKERKKGRKEAKSDIQILNPVVSATRVRSKRRIARRAAVAAGSASSAFYPRCVTVWKMDSGGCLEREI